MSKTRTTDPRSARGMVQPQELHCSQCGRYLGEHSIAWGYIRFQCSGCRAWVSLDIAPDK